ncbi:hypothetical protein GCM10009788_34500 [Nocardioides humi]|uniref:Uncharacterized protein n=1 Tax=Nocardioides humi TaxID=449461 RepID=A0ABN2AYI7_9ACTN
MHGCWDVDFQILHDVATVNLPTVAEGLGQALADQSDPTADD